MRLLCRGWWLKDRLRNLAAFTLSCYLKTIWFPQDAWGVRVVRDVCKIVPTINHRISACWRDRILYGTVPLCSNTAAPAVLCASTSVFSLQSTRALLALKKKNEKKNERDLITESPLWLLYGSHSLPERRSGFTITALHKTINSDSTCDLTSV